MIQFCPASSVSALPSAEEVISQRRRNIGYKVTLPCYVLSFCTSPQFNGHGYLFVTDFTKNKESLVAKGGPTSLLRKHFFIGSGPEISEDLVFSISFPKKDIPQLMNSIMGSIKPERRSYYDFNDVDKCQLELEGIFLNLTFKLNDYQNLLLGYYFKHEVLNSFTIDKYYPQDGGKAYVIPNLSRRYCEYSDFYHTTCVRENSPFPISKYIDIEEFDFGNNQENEFSTIEFGETQANGPIVSQIKRRRLNEFYETEEDSQQPIRLYTESQPVNNQRVILDTQRSQLEDIEDVEFSDENEDIENSLPPLTRLGELKQLAHEQVKHGYEHIKRSPPIRVRARLQSFEPRHQFILKPFGRTMKISNFKMNLADNSTVFPVEFNTQEEICQFFRIKEIEEITRDMVRVLTRLNHLPTNSQQIDLLLQQKIMPLQPTSSLMRTYWTCQNDFYHVTRLDG